MTVGGGGKEGAGKPGDGGGKDKPLKEAIIDLLIHPCGGKSKLEAIKCVLDFLKGKDDKPENGDDKPDDDDDKPQDGKPSKPNDGKCKCKDKDKEDKAMQRTFDDIACFFECIIKPKPDHNSKPSTTTITTTTSTTTTTTTTTTITTTTTTTATTSGGTTTTKKPDKDEDKCKCKRKLQGKDDKKILDCLIDCFLNHSKPPTTTQATTTTTKKPDDKCADQKERTFGCLFHNFLKPSVVIENERDLQSFDNTAIEDGLGQGTEDREDCTTKRTLGCLFLNMFNIGSDSRRDKSQKIDNFGKLLNGDLRIVLQ